MQAKSGPISKRMGHTHPRSAPPARGRPPVEIDLGDFEKLAAMNCTQVEMAGFFGMHITTLEKKLASDELLETKHGQLTLRELLEIGRAKGRISIRRQQMALLEKGNATMAIWLGKNLLGQSDDGPVGGYDSPPTIDDDDLDLDP